MTRRQFQRQREKDRRWLFKTRVREHLNADALNGAVRKIFEQVPEVGYQIPLTDCLMSGASGFGASGSDRARLAQVNKIASQKGLFQALNCGFVDQNRPSNRFRVWRIHPAPSSMGPDHVVSPKGMECGNTCLRHPRWTRSRSIPRIPNRQIGLSSQDGLFNHARIVRALFPPTGSGSFRTPRLR